MKTLALALDTLDWKTRFTLLPAFVFVFVYRHSLVQSRQRDLSIAERSLFLSIPADSKVTLDLSLPSEGLLKEYLRGSQPLWLSLIAQVGFYWLCVCSGSRHRGKINLERGARDDHPNKDDG